jgi:hypothetical protein
LGSAPASNPGVTSVANRRFGENAYELEPPEDVGILPIFNISNLYPYREDGEKRTEDQIKIQWEKQILVAEKS